MLEISPGPKQPAPKPIVGEVERLVPSEPGHIGRLPRCRCWIDVIPPQQITKIEMGVTSGSGMHVDVYQRRGGIQMP